MSELRPLYHPGPDLVPDLTDAALLSLWQPWASAVADGVKGVETRGYRTRYRGWLLIQAAQHKLTRAERAVIPVEVLDYGLGRTLPLGAVVAIARLVTVVGVDVLEWRPPSRFGSWWRDDDHLRIAATERPWGGYGSGRFAWLLDDVRRLDRPIPARGHQGGPRAADPAVVAAVVAQLSAPDRTREDDA